MQPTLGLVNIQHANRRAPDWRCSNESGAIPAEMCAPYIASRIKQAHNVSRGQIKSGNVIEFKAVAVRTSEGKILRNALAGMLARNNMVRNKFHAQEHRWKMAVLAAMTCSLRDELVVRSRH